MRPVLWFRAAAVVMVLFAAAHTFGFLTFRPPTAESQAVWDAMQRVQFSVGTGSYSYRNFYVGLGLFDTVAMLFGASLLWIMGAMAERPDALLRPIAFAVFLWQLASAVLSLMYFSVAPAIFSALVALCLALGTRIAPRLRSSAAPS